MKQPGLNHRHRDKDGEISNKHGNTLIGTLRSTYGPTFASGFSDQDKLSDVLQRLDEPSLSKLVRDHAAGRLHQITRGEAIPVPTFDVVHVFGPAGRSASAARPAPRRHDCKHISHRPFVSSYRRNATIIEFRDVFKRLADE